MNTRLFTILFSLLLVFALLTGFLAFWNTPELQAARAFEIKSAAESEAAARQATLNTQAEQTRLTNETTIQTQPAQVLAWQIIYVGSASILMVALAGGTIGLLIWLGVRAASIYPNQSGQMPLVKLSGMGWQGIVDPNRAPGPVTVFNTPTIFDWMAEASGRLRGQPTNVPALRIEMPLSVSEAGSLNASAQASAVAMTVAASRQPGVGRSQQVLDRTQMILSAPQLTAPLPTVEYIDESHVTRLLAMSNEEGGPDG